MKKTLEYFYIFSKLSTSFILLICLIVLGYFFFISFQNQENSKNEQEDILIKLEENSKIISNIVTKISTNDIILSEIKETLETNNEINYSNELILLSEKIQGLYSELNIISKNIEKIESIDLSKIKETKNKDFTITILEKNKKELARLITTKFENNINYTEELSLLQNLNGEKNENIFEKINLIMLNNFRGNSFIKNIFAKESDIFLKEKHTQYPSSFFKKSLMNFIEIKPSNKNVVENNDIYILKEIERLIEEKKYSESYNRIIKLKDYESFFSVSLEQIKIAIEFMELIKKVS